MGKLASKLTKRIMAVALSTAMILSNMTVYASELSGPVQQTEETVENTETDVVELPSTNDETANDETSQDDASQGENSNDETTQDGITQDETTSDGDSEAPDDAETGDESASEGTDEEIPAADDAASEEEVEAEDASNDVDTPTAVADTPPTVWIVGDSTVCDFVGKGQDLTYYYPRYGYGTQIGNYLSIPKENIQNLAASGRSSKSYLVENAADYATLTSGIKAGDVLIIGFGHNDEKLEEARYTNPNGDWKTEGSFAKSLYDNYIKKAQDKNAEVILCTPIVRRGSEAKLTDSQKHITASKDGYEGGNYAQAIRKLGEDAKVPVVDLTTLTTTLYEDLGPEQTKFLHAWGNSKGVPDDTHLNIYGAKKVAWLFAKELKRLNDAAAADNKITLAGYLLNELTEPTKDSDLVVNDKYVEKDYAPPTGNSAYQDYVITGTNGDVHFKGSAFGDLGGAPSTSLQILKTDSDGNMNISVNSNKGKVTATSDGIAMYYYQLPKDAQFTFSAKATVNAIDLSNAQLQQIAFGLMARDDMYIDVNDKSISSDYVVAGSLGTGTNCFYKNSNQLVSGGALKNEIIDAGKSYELKIISTGDGYECTFGTEDPRTSGFDFQLLSIDSQYVYIGMFVARNADVTFNNIYLEVDGQVIADTRKIEYTVTVTSDENGTASTNKSSAAPGETVTLSARPNYGYEFDRWEVISGGITVDADNKFIMPASNVEIKAIFKEKAGKTIEVWDFGGYEETDTAKYTNYITPDKLKPYVKTEATKGQYYGTAPAVFGDLSMYFVANDRLYTTVAELGSYSYGAYAAAQKAYPDGYTAKGAWYGNGSGNANQRYVLIDNVQAGDKIIAYMGSHQTSGCTFTFAGQGAASAQTETVSVETSEFKKFEFVAQYTGTYKIYQSGDTGKIMYHRIMRVPAVTVTGEIDFDDNDIPDGYSVKFVNQTTKGESVATVEEDGTFTVSLAAGYTYKAVLAGAIGYGFTNASANVTTKDAEALTGKSGVLLVVEPKSTYLFSGTIRGFAPDYDLTNLVMTMTPSANSDASEVKLDITKADSKLTFSADLEPEVEYSIVLGGVNDYRVLSPLVVNKDGEGTSFENRTIVVGLKPMYSVVGGFIGLDKGTQVSKLTFTNLADNYSYDATVANGGYSIELRDGDYSVSATVTDYETNTHVAVDGGSISKDLLFVSTAPKAEIDYVSDIYVGYPDKAHNYATVSEAVEACELMKWTDTAQEGGAVKKARTADQRVTIHIAPGTYREQIIVNAPYVSFVNDTDEEVLLTWYYGIGYKYYSAASTGFYNAEDAYDKFNKGIAQRWGVTVFVKNTATAFRAENITFENSFNRYITEEELEDGVELSYTESIRFVRNYGVDVKSKAATERAAAITIQGDQAEFLNCGFYSSQDTLGTLGGHIYFKNCVIEGQTDYICGQGTAVFDACELRWKGYSTGSQGGYIAVSQASATDLGYLFRNCTITANSKLDVKSGYFGRPWSPTAATTFINTKLQNADMIVSEGWTVMSGNKPEDARYHEYNTTTIAGEAVSTTGRTAGTVMTAEEAKAIKVSDYFGASWTPVYYTEEADTVEIQGNVTVTDNADINTPKAGNTLTVHYSLGDNNANDASIIRWYSVEKNADGTEKAGSEKLLKISTAAVNKTYKVEEGLVGKYIKVTVTPQTVSGKSGTAKSCTLEKPIAEGYEDPSNESGITRGDGINIFLAGDSTVKDYSASGMYNGGTPLNEGSWGEFIQSFFNESEVTIQNYAQGGRSSRTFINEGKLDSIAENIQEGDYLFIQFGHNDSSNTYADRYVPVGTKGDDGKYPRTPGTKNSSGIYPDGGSGTFKWFLLQYIEVAKAHNAIPVLVTPVSRMYYNSDGTIKTHHDDNTSSNDAYVVAMKELAEEEHVLLIDGFKLTKDLFEAAWSAWEGDTNKKDTYGKQIMASGDSTHNNKLGGMIEAALIATAIQGKNLDISYAVKAPSKVIGTTTANTEVFSVNDNGILTAYDINSSYTARATYWEGIGQKMFDDIKSTADDLSTKGTEGTLNAPKAAPGSGTVEKGTDVVLTVEGAEEDTYEIIYTTDGTSPKAESNPSAKNYSEEGPIQINENTTIKAYAKATGETPTDGKTLTDSKVVTYVYTLAPSVKAPTASEPSRSEIPVGTVIKLTTVTENAKIRYTMGSDPSDPTIYSPLYDDESGIKVTTAITIKAIAVLEDEKSDVATFTYTVSADTSTEEIAAPEFDKAAGDVSIGDVVKLTAAEGTLIYYTMGNNPADPTTSNADLYDDGIVINRSATIKAIAVKGNSVSAIASRTYTVPTAAAPTASPAPSAEPVPAGTKVTLSSSDGSDAEIWYTVDRTDPRHSDTKAKYQSAIPINDNTTIKAYAKLAGKADSDVVTFTYTIPTADIPVADPAPSEVLIGTTVTLTSEGATIYYTLDGTDPKTNENKKTYESGITIEDDTTIKAYAVKQGCKDSRVVTFRYTVPTAAAPVASPGSSEVLIGTAVTLTSEGATIYYTLDGTDPKTNENKKTYQSGITIEDDTTIKAYAVKQGCKDSRVITFTYTVPTADIPVASPDQGSVSKGTSVSLTSEGATIYYTLDGTDPKTNENKKTYESAIIINATTTITTYAEKEGYKDSEVVAYTYTVKSDKPTNNEGFKITLSEDSYTYTGSAIIPDADDYEVTYNGMTLIEGIDYTVKYSNNIKVSSGTSKAKMTVTGKGNLSGNAFETFTITAKSLKSDNEEGLGAVQGDVIYVAKGSKATPVLSYGGIQLTTKDFDITKGKDTKWNESKSEGITIKGKGNFIGERTLDVEVLEKEAQKNAKITVKLDSAKNKNLTYTGEDVYPEFEVTTKSGLSSKGTGEKALKEAKDGEEGDYIVSYPEDMSSAGKKKFTVIGISPICVGTVTKTYTVKPAPKSDTAVKVTMDDEEVKASTSLTFVSTGSTFTQEGHELEVTYDGTPLVEGTDYKITYSGNKKVGNKAKYTITGLGNYKGVKKSGNFTITEADITEAVEVVVPDVVFSKPKSFKSKPFVIEKESNTVLKTSYYTVKYLDNAVNGKELKEVKENDEVWVTITGKGGYKGTTEPVKYVVKKGTKDLSKAKIAFYDQASAPKATSKFGYTGGAVKPAKIEIIFKDKSKVPLTLGENGKYTNEAYDVTLVNNVNKGKATVIIKYNTDDANVVGGKSATFSINASSIKK